jgi:hypothetical protein
VTAVYARQPFTYGDPAEFIIRGAQRDDTEACVQACPDFFAPWPLTVPPLTQAEARYLMDHPRGPEVGDSP